MFTADIIRLAVVAAEQSGCGSYECIVFCDDNSPGIIVGPIVIANA